MVKVEIPTISKVNKLIDTRLREFKKEFQKQISKLENRIIEIENQEDRIRIFGEKKK